MDWYVKGLGCEAGAIPEVSEHDARARGLFGPVWHGTTRREEIDQAGFQVFIGDTGSENLSHGYEAGHYANGAPPPVHHLGFGVYFTTVKSIGKRFGYGSAGPAYFLDVPRLETINFGAPNTMMKWWIANGYSPEIAKLDRVAATQRLTNHLKAQWDAVWYKGKGLHRLLDGDQICIFEPAGRVYQLNSKLALPGQIGSRVRRIGHYHEGVMRPGDGMIGIIMKVDEDRMEFIRDLRQKDPELARRVYHPNATKFYWVKWRRGGTDCNVQDVEVELLPPG